MKNKILLVFLSGLCASTALASPSVSPTPSPTPGSTAVSKSYYGEYDPYSESCEAQNLGYRDTMLCALTSEIEDENECCAGGQERYYTKYVEVKCTLPDWNDGEVREPEATGYCNSPRVHCQFDSSSEPCQALKEWCENFTRNNVRNDPSYGDKRDTIADKMKCTPSDCVLNWKSCHRPSPSPSPASA